MKSPRFILIACIGLHASLAALFSITRHVTFKTSMLDIGAFENILFNLIHGSGLITHVVPPYVEQPWLGFHFSPILYLVAPLYALFPATNTLLILHSAFIALAAWPMFLVARTLLGCEKKALVVAALYLINPFVLNAAMWDFHEIAFAPLAFALGLLAVIKQRRWLLIVSCAVLLATKEHYGLAVAGFAVLWFSQTRERKFSLMLGVSGLLIGGLVVGIIMPHLSPQGAHFMLQANQQASDRYSWLLSSNQHLHTLFKMVGSGVVYIMLLCLPLIALLSASWIWMFPALADGIANILSLNGMMRSPMSYHSAALIPIVLTCAVVAYTKLDNTKQKPKAVLVLYASIFFAYVFSCLPLPGAVNLWETERIQLHYDAEDAAALADIKQIIGDQPIATQINVGAHLAARRAIYSFPERQAHLVVLRLQQPFKSLDAIFSVPYANYASMTTKEKEAAIGFGYREIYNKHGWVVLSNE